MFSGLVMCGFSDYMRQIMKTLMLILLDESSVTATRPIASENRCKLYPPERKLTKAILTLLNLEGEAQGEI